MSGLWVLSETMPDGSYGVAITVGEDRAFTLTRDAAVGYAVSAFATATAAEHSTAVLRLLTAAGPSGLGLPPQYAAEFLLRDLRPERLHTHAATEPLAFTVAIGRARIPRVDAGAFQAAVRIRLGDLEVGHVSPGELREHAGGVLTALAAADLDANLRRCLTTRVGLPDGDARAVVGGLAEYMPTVGSP